MADTTPTPPETPTPLVIPTLNLPPPPQERPPSVPPASGSGYRRRSPSAPSVAASDDAHHYRNVRNKISSPSIGRGDEVSRQRRSSPSIGRGDEVSRQRRSSPSIGRGDEVSRQRRRSPSADRDGLRNARNKHRSPSVGDRDGNRHKRRSPSADRSEGYVGRRRSPSADRSDGYGRRRRSPSADRLNGNRRHRSPSTGRNGHSTQDDEASENSSNRARGRDASRERINEDHRARHRSPSYGRVGESNHRRRSPSADRSGGDGSRGRARSPRRNKSPSSRVLSPNRSALHGSVISNNRSKSSDARDRDRDSEYSKSQVSIGTTIGEDMENEILSAVPLGTIDENQLTPSSVVRKSKAHRKKRSKSEGPKKRSSAEPGEWQKTESQRFREKALLNELVTIVNKRDEIDNKMNIQPQQQSQNQVINHKVAQIEPDVISRTSIKQTREERCKIM